jgi:hypothetical protein
MKMSNGKTDGERLHEYFNSLTRYRWDSIGDIPFDDGIYIVFEAGERYANTDLDRVVRVGTHTADGGLKRRLKNHFVRESKDSSIFRKNIGKAILKERGDAFLGKWSRKAALSAEDAAIQRRVENQVTEYMRPNLSFVVIPVDGKAARLRLEEGIIATIHGDPAFRPGREWLGRHSPEQKICESGLWLKDGLSGEQLHNDELSGILGRRTSWLFPHIAAIPQMAADVKSGAELRRMIGVYHQSVDLAASAVCGCLRDSDIYYSGRQIGKDGRYYNEMEDGSLVYFDREPKMLDDWIGEFGERYCPVFSSRSEIPAGLQDGYSYFRMSFVDLCGLMGKNVDVYVGAIIDPYTNSFIVTQQMCARIPLLPTRWRTLTAQPTP